jgi:hypothetical protein
MTTTFTAGVRRIARLSQVAVKRDCVDTPALVSPSTDSAFTITARADRRQRNNRVVDFQLCPQRHAGLISMPPIGTSNPYYAPPGSVK